MNLVHKNYDELFSLDNVFNAWGKFRRGKAGKRDVMDFELHLEDNLFGLYEDLRRFNYQHSSYKHFRIFDNKKRDIYQAEVRDKVVHQIIYDYLLSLYEPEFIADSYASRINKGQYRAINVFRYFIKLAGGNNGKCFILKCDVRKYFDNIDQNILLGFIRRKVICEKTLAIIKEIIWSYIFSGPHQGVPLGNVTSQIFANIYLNALDEYVKRELKCRFYVRYNDDLVVVSASRAKLEEIRSQIILFVRDKLLLNIPFEKTSVRKIDWGIDFLGFTILPRAVLLRNKTKHKMFAKLNRQNAHSYFGILKHCQAYNLRRKLLALDKFDEIC